MNQYQPISHNSDPYRPISHKADPLSLNFNINHQQLNLKAQLNSNINNQEKNILQNNYYDSQVNQENPQILRQSQLEDINNKINILQNDIVQNNKQIRLLNNKITKSDFQQAQLKKLYQKQQKLKEKQQQYERIIMSNEFLKQEMQINKLKQTQLKHSLGNQYQQIVEDRKRRQRQQRQRQIQQQALMNSYNQQAIQQQYQRKKQFIEQQKRHTLTELQKRQQARQLQKNQKQMEKLQYNQILNHRNQLETQKDHVYRQYYKHFMEQQQKLQNIYKNKALEAQISKGKQRNQQQRKQFQTFQMKMARQNQEKLRKITYQRESLRNYLQAQIQQNNRKKAREKQQENRYQNQVRQYQMTHIDYQNLQKQRKRQEQRRYDLQLATQMQFKNRISIEPNNRSSSLGHYITEGVQQSQRKTHNPVTNPIDFKIGITNPYVIKQYENTKQKYMGDHNLKLRNLAMIGNNSLIHSQR